MALITNRAVIKGGAASTLLSFLDSKKGVLDPVQLVLILTDISVSVLRETSDFSLLNCLKKVGWNESNNCYDGDVNVETLSAELRKIIGRRDNKLSSFRASQVGLRNTMKSFVPDLLMVHTIEERFHTESARLTPFSVFFDGVVLLADISGFTRLSGKFCEEGRDGIDQLQQATNGYLGLLVKIVYAYGGDVIKFAGDALVCVFRSSKYGVGGFKMTLADVCSNAVQCATELTQVCTAQLTVHVAASCGSICFAMLGGFNNVWECLVSGQCLGHLSQCLEDATSKQTVVSPDFVAMLGPNNRKELNIEELPSGNYRVICAVTMGSVVVRKMIKKRGEMLLKDSESRFTLFPNDDEFLTALSHFVPMSVSIGLLSGSFDFLAELREVTTVFLHWDSYDEVEHRDLLSLQKFFEAAQKILAQCGAFIRQFLVDDKGCVLIACWGVPAASYTDNGRRALCAGAMIGYELNELGMKTSVGITTGNVFCGSVGSYVRREYAVIGDVVNLAARLMSKANGGLIIDEATYQTLPGFLQDHLEMLPPMAIKGKDALITPYSLRHDKGMISFDDQGDGDFQKNIRSVCKAPLVEHMNLIGTADGPVPLKFIMIVGKTGTGKVDVVTWLKLTCPTRDIRIVVCPVTPVDAAGEYRVAQKLFRLLVREAIFDNPMAQQIIVMRILGEIYGDDRETAEKVGYAAMEIALGVTCPYLDSCRSLSDGSLGDRLGSDSDGSSNSVAALHVCKKRLPPTLLNQSLRDIFSYLFNITPVVVVVEQAHFADYLSWTVLVNWVSIASLALVVITMEPLEDLAAKMNEPPTPASTKKLFIPYDNNAPVAFRRLVVMHKKLLNFKETTLVKMSDYSIPDVDQLLCSVLNVVICPEGVASMVHQLSGGNPFWCREMALFISSTGAEEFMRAMRPQETGELTRRPSLNGSTRLSTPHNSSRVSASRLKNMYSSTSTRGGVTSQSADAAKLIDLARQKPTRGGVKDPHKHRTVSLNHTALTSIPLEVRSPQKQDQARIWSSSSGEGRDQFCPLSPASDATTSKLGMLVICRFEKLSSEDQNCLRTASIIGLDFSTDTLQSILAPKMRAQMFDSILSLVRNQWLRESDGEVSSEYSFVHPLLYQTIYDLTPAGDKARMHYAVATHIEDAHEGKPSHFALLGLQYSLAGDCNPKALEYYARAAVYCISSGPAFYNEGINMVTYAMQFAVSTSDYGTMLGIVMDKKEMLSFARKHLASQSRSSRLGRSDRSPQPTVKRVLLPFTKMKVIAPQIDPRCVDLDDEVDHAGVLTLRGTDVFIALFASLEEELNVLYSAALQGNTVSVTAPWQVQFLAKRKELIKKEELRRGELHFSLNRRLSTPIMLSDASVRLVSHIAKTFSIGGSPLSSPPKKKSSSSLVFDIGNVLSGSNDCLSPSASPHSPSHSRRSLFGEKIILPQVLLTLPGSHFTPDDTDLISEHYVSVSPKRQRHRAQCSLS